MESDPLMRETASLSGLMLKFLMVWWMSCDGESSLGSSARAISSRARLDPDLVIPGAIIFFDPNVSSSAFGI
jgi:hypothetical protein